MTFIVRQMCVMNKVPSRAWPTFLSQANMVLQVIIVLQVNTVLQKLLDEQQQQQQHSTPCSGGALLATE